ncbi:MAG: glucose 1-dehydrogenase [Flavobacteriaceae bacterium]|jgi:NAD(P)-dependent dehydrogenase (short-subunit alcohol dehydrogenase family)|nr:glucose 1-dehydrogenase [Flavobacteriaceae bacterium]
MKLDDKVAVVSGGGSGFGRAMSLLYAKEGAKVVVSDIISERGEETIDLITKDGGEAIFIKADASSASDNEKLIKQTVDHYGRLDIAFNNAGIGGSSAPIGEYPVEAWDKIIAVNLSSVFYGMRFQIPQMLKNGGGVIVNMASILGQVGFAGACGYVAAKHGVVGLTKNVALEYGKQGIRANSVGPGFVETNLTHDLIENKDAYDFLVYKHPMGRLGKVDEIVDLVLWLSSDRASFCNGGYYTVDGGYLAK